MTPLRVARSLGGLVRHLVLRSGVRHFILIPIDALIGVACFWGAMLVRFEGGIPDPALRGMVLATLLLALARMTASLLLLAD